MSDDTRVFVCYRRADEPFLAALIWAALDERLGRDRVFLDTINLLPGQEFEQPLLEGVRSGTALLAVIGDQWGEMKNLARLADPLDWVRRELLEAREAGVQVVPILWDGTGVPHPDTLPEALSWLPASTRHEKVSRLHYWADINHLADGIAIKGEHRNLDRETVRRATLALLQHALPEPQRRSANDKMIAAAIAANWVDDDWFRYATAGRLPGRPRGSGIVTVTDTELRVLDLKPDFEARQVVRRPLNQLTIELTPRQRLWRPTADLRVRCSGYEDLEILGVFREESEVLIDTASRTDRHRC